MVRGPEDGSRRRRGSDVDSPWNQKRVASPPSGSDGFVHNRSAAFNKIIASARQRFPDRTRSDDVKAFNEWVLGLRSPPVRPQMSVLAGFPVKHVGFTVRLEAELQNVATRLGYDAPPPVTASHCVTSCEKGDKVFAGGGIAKRRNGTDAFRGTADFDLYYTTKAAQRVIQWYVCRADTQRTGRGGAAAATRIIPWRRVRGDAAAATRNLPRKGVAVTPRPRGGYSVDASGTEPTSTPLASTTTSARVPSARCGTRRCPRTRRRPRRRTRRRTPRRRRRTRRRARRRTPTKGRRRPRAPRRRTSCNHPARRWRAATSRTRQALVKPSAG